MDEQKREYTVNGCECHLSWDGEGFDPKKYNIARKSIYNSQGMLYCTSCGKFKEKGAFQSKDGVAKAPCKECRAKYQRNIMSDPENKRLAAIQRAEKKGDATLVELLKVVPSLYFKDSRFNVRYVNLEDIPVELRGEAEKLGFGAAFVVKEKKRRGRKPGSKVGKYKTRKPKSKVKGRNDRVALRGTFGIHHKKKIDNSDLSGGVECPVCDTIKPLEKFKSRYSYCCSACEKRLRGGESALFVRNREELVGNLDKFEELSRVMHLDALNGKFDDYLSSRKELDMLRARINFSINYKYGNHATVYSFDKNIQ